MPVCLTTGKTTGSCVYRGWPIPCSSKRKVTVGNGQWNFFGIDYVADTDQYVLMANRPADYSFIFTDGDFQVTDTLNLGLSASRSSFQDFCVAGDSYHQHPIHAAGWIHECG